MRDEIDALARLADYEDLPPAIEALQGQLLTARVGDDMPAIGEALQCGATSYARVLRHSGNRRVQAQHIGPDTLAKGTEVTRTHQPAAFPPPRDGVLDLAGLGFVPQTADAIPFTLPKPGFSDIDGARTPLEVGIEPIDMLTPIARGGITLVLDGCVERDPFESLLTKTLESVSDETSVLGLQDILPHNLPARHITHGPRPEDQVMALRAAMSWASHGRDDHTHQLVILELPAWRLDEALPLHRSGMEVTTSKLLNLLGAALTSTREGTVTTLVRLHIDPSAGGLLDVAETLDLGDVDTQIHIDVQGTYNPLTSRTRVEPPTPERQAQRMAVRSAIGRALTIDARLAITPDDVTDEELRTLESLDALCVDLT